MIHYHGTPITPKAVLQTLHGKHFCVSFARPDNVEACHKIGQSVMLDNGAFSVWRRGYAPDWKAYYEWCNLWLAYASTWAVIPDVIDGTEDAQDDLLFQWPFADRGAPVWHLNEPIERALLLSDQWPLVCWGSASEYAVVGSIPWRRRVEQVFTALSKRHRHIPKIHMLRGMKCCEMGLPFYSLDSTDVARNHARGGSTARERADRWDAQNGPAGYNARPIQQELIA